MEETGASQVLKDMPVNMPQETWFNPWVGKIPWRRKWQPTPVFLPGKTAWTEEPGGLQSMGLQKSWTRLSTHMLACGGDANS